MSDEVDKLTQRALAAADGILAQGLREIEGDTPESLPLDVVRHLIAAGFGTGKQEGLAEGRAVVVDLQGQLETLVASLRREGLL